MTQERLRVLLIEDDEVEAGLIRCHLAGSGGPLADIDHVQRLGVGLDRLRNGRYDVVLLDLQLPDGRGIENLRRVRAESTTAPVIILTNLEEQDIAVAEGAQDYLIKRNTTSDMLRRAIRYAIARQESELSRIASEERYALAVAGARDGIWDWDLEREEVYYSPRCLAMLGLAGTDAPPRPSTWLSRVHDEDRTGLEHALAAHLSGVTAHVEHEFRISAGATQKIWMLCRGLAVRDASGRATRIAGSLSDISDRKVAEALLVHEALHDTLTGLPNRQLFLDRLDLALKQHRRDHTRRFALLFLDLDRFKTVNDTLGHAAGDELLVEFSRRLRSCLRPGDSIARLGGDEFAVLLTHVEGIREVTQVVERIHDWLSPVFLIAGTAVSVTASIGVAMSGPQYERSADLLRDADLAMYDIKGRRAGSYAFFDNPSHKARLRRLEIESDLCSALAHDEFVIYYQPIVSLKHMQILGFEALLRWFHPLRGLIGPDEFIPIAEKCGVIGPLSWWVMKQACRQVRIWQESDPRLAELSISVNVSSRLFAEPGFAMRTRAILEETQLKPQLLHLEITENALLQHESATIDELTALQGIGVKFHLDDFGTGYSSLSYLSMFRYDTIKIDRSFVSASGEGNRNRRIVDALISLGRGLDMDVIAEGVETQEQAQKLFELDCRVAQGYWFSKPLPSASVCALLVHEGSMIGPSSFGTLSY